MQKSISVLTTENRILWWLAECATEVRLDPAMARCGIPLPTAAVVGQRSQEVLVPSAQLASSDFWGKIIPLPDSHQFLVRFGERIVLNQARKMVELGAEEDSQLR